MTVFYLSPHARITHEVFEVRYPTPRRFMICDLEGVYVVRGTNGWIVARLTPVQVCSGALSGVAGLVVVGGPAFGSTPITVVATVALAVSLAVSTVCGRQRRSLHPHQIWAVHKDGLVCLFSSTDAIVFGQVRRALIRVLEWRDDTR
jgi:hypothetical protein